MSRSHLLRDRSLLGLSGALLLASCGNSGANVGAIPGGPSPTGPVDIDFSVRRDLHFGGNQVSDVLVLDLDGDGRTDLVEANFADMTIRIAFGIPTAGDPIVDDPFGGFSLGFVLPTTSPAWQLSAGDVDGDGRTDVVVAEVDALGGGTPGVEVFFQTSAGVFGPSAFLAAPGDVFDVEVLDASGVTNGGGGDRIYAALPDNGEIAGIEWDGTDLAVIETLDSSALGAAGDPFSISGIDEGQDGLIDLAVGEVNLLGGTLPDRLVLYRNTGTGFSDPDLILNGLAGPVVDDVGDVDDNGFADLGIAQIADNDTILLAGADGTGVLTDAVTVSFGTPTTSVLYEDFDGDGLMDAAAAGLNTQEISLRMGNAPLVPAIHAGGGAPYDPPMSYNVGLVPLSVKAGEVTQDGVVDLLCASNDNISILRNEGGGQFRGTRGYMVGSEPILVQCADLDGDNDNDVVVIDHLQRQVGFLENTDGLGTFELVTEVPFAIPASKKLPGGFVLEDVDGDNMKDVVVALHQMGEVHVLRNPGSFAAWTEAPPADVYAVGAQLLGVACADVNGDSALDVMTCSEGDQTLRILLNDPSNLGTFTETTPIVLPFTPAAILAEDLNGDLIADVALTGRQGPSSDPVLGVLSGDGNAGFSVEAVFPTDVLGATLTCGDFDQNGLCDLVVGQPEESVSELPILLNTGDFSFEAQSLATDANPGAVAVANVDFDLDGNLDLIIPTGVGELRIAIGAGDGTFPVIEPPAQGFLTTPHGTTFACYADVDGDPLPDLMMVSPSAPNLWIARNISVELASM